MQTKKQHTIHVHVYMWVEEIQVAVMWIERVGELIHKVMHSRAHWPRVLN